MIREGIVHNASKSCLAAQMSYLWRAFMLCEVRWTASQTPALGHNALRAWKIEWDERPRNTPSFQSFSRKGEAESWITILDYYAALSFLLQISVRVCVWHRCLPTSRCLNMSVPPVVTDMTQVSPSLSTTHQNLWPGHSKAPHIPASALASCLE